ncbi:MAG: hypothetical protein CL908_13315 [Deltaproteobacteria bacterium]|nr:hypothetical protein [Deltaproteobacteria bacterium]
MQPSASDEIDFATLGYSPFLPEVMTEPYSFYRYLRSEAPAYYMEQYDAWALTRFADVWAAARSPETFCNAQGTTAANVLSRLEAPVPSINQIDRPDHTRLRSALRSHFTRNRVARFEPEIRKEVRQTLDSHSATGEIDAVRDLADPLAARVACRLLCLPEEAGPLLTRWVHRYAANEPADQGRSSDALAASIETNQYLAEFVKARRRSGGDGKTLVDIFLSFETGGRRLEDLEIASHLQTLVVGGTDTTPKVIATALQQLFLHPEQRAKLAADPGQIPAAFTEALRYEAPTQYMARTVAAPITLHSQNLVPGQGVLLLYAAANRDEREFENPDRFDVERAATRNLGFGHAAHVCIGAQIARLEARVVLEEILHRFPDYTIDERRIEHRRADQIRGAISMPMGIRESRS